MERASPACIAFESGCGRETDSLLEGGGFEPSVPLPRLSSIRAVRAEIIGRSTDVLRYHAADESGDHLQCCHVGRERPWNSGERLRRRTGPFRVVGLATIERSGQMILSAVTAPLLVARSRAIARQRGSRSSDSAASAAP